MLASVIYHLEWLQNWVTVQPGHPYFFMPLIHNPELLSRLKLKVTLDAVCQSKHATGIPPHIENTCLCENMLRLCEEILTIVKVLMIQVKYAVKDAFEDKS